MTPSRITADDFRQVLRDGMPSVAELPFEFVVLERGLAVLRLPTAAPDLRPGGIVAGPLLFQLADLAMYAAVMSAIGKEPMAVTTDATMHFLRSAPAEVLLARATLLKTGKRLVVGDVVITTEAENAPPLAHAVMSYSVPPRERRGPPSG